MQWWAWIAGGAVLLGAELALVDAQFYLVLLGAAAIVAGLVDLAWPGLPAWMPWLVFSGLAVGSMLGIRRRIYARIRPKLPDMRTGPVGESIVVPQALAPGESCRVEFRGSSWSAQNGGHEAIVAGAQARIVRVDGLTLVLRG